MNKLYFSFFYLLLALSNIVNAVESENNAVVELNRQSSPAGNCPLISFNDNSLPETGGRETNFNSSCFVDVKAIDSHDYQIVDVRSERDFQQGHIANSINIPLHQIANKRFLKKKNILLVNTGLPQFEMGQFCQILKDKGFDNVKIMKGGLHNWLGQNLPLAGTGYPKQLFDIVKIADFMMDYDNNLIQVVNIKTENGEYQRIVSDAKLIALNNAKWPIKQQLDQLIADEKATQKQIVVILTENDYFTLKQQLGNAILQDIYYLIGDKGTLNTFKQTRKTINQARINGPRAQTCGS